VSSHRDLTCARSSLARAHHLREQRRISPKDRFGTEGVPTHLRHWWQLGLEAGSKGGNLPEPSLSVERPVGQV